MGQAHLRLFLALAIAVVAAVSASPGAAGSHGTCPPCANPRSSTGSPAHAVGDARGRDGSIRRAHAKQYAHWRLKRA